MFASFRLFATAVSRDYSMLIVESAAGAKRILRDIVGRHRTNSDA